MAVVTCFFFEISGGFRRGRARHRANSQTTYIIHEDKKNNYHTLYIKNTLICSHLSIQHLLVHHRTFVVTFPSLSLGARRHPCLFFSFLFSLLKISKFFFLKMFYIQVCMLILLYFLHEAVAADAARAVGLAHDNG